MSLNLVFSSSPFILPFFLPLFSTSSFSPSPPLSSPFLIRSLLLELLIVFLSALFFNNTFLSQYLLSVIFFPIFHHHHLFNFCVSMNNGHICKLNFRIFTISTIVSCQQCFCFIIVVNRKKSNTIPYPILSS